MTIVLGASAIAVAVAFLLVAIAAVVRIIRVAPGPQVGSTGSAPDFRTTVEWSALKAQVAEQEIAIQRLPSLWQHERELAEAANETAKRRYAAARAAESRINSDSGPDEESEDFGDEEVEGTTQRVLSLHAEGGESGELPAVPGRMGDDAASDLAERAAAVGWTPFL